MLDRVERSGLSTLAATTACLVALAAGCDTAAERGSEVDEADGHPAVDGNVVTPTGFPPAVIELDEELRYVGSDEFVLGGRADTDVHVYAEADDAGQVLRLYWIQLEGYLPSVDRRYDYSGSQGRTEIDGHMYYEDAWVWDLDAIEIDPASDTGHVLALLRDDGLRLGPDLIGLRLVRLDAARRNELLIVYFEDLAAAGLGPDALSGPDRARTVEGLRGRALGGFSIEERAGAD